SREVVRQAAGIDLERAHDARQVRCLLLQDLMEPVNELDIRVAAQLAEHGRAFDRLVRKAVQLAEQCDPIDVSHDVFAPMSSFVRSMVSGSRPQASARVRPLPGANALAYYLQSVVGRLPPALESQRPPHPHDARRASSSNRGATPPLRYRQGVCPECLRLAATSALA